MIKLHPKPPSKELGRPRQTERKSLTLYSVKGASAYAGVSTTTVRRWVRDGVLKFYRAGRQIE